MPHDGNERMTHLVSVRDRFLYALVLAFALAGCVPRDNGSVSAGSPIPSVSTPAPIAVTAQPINSARELTQDPLAVATGISMAFAQLPIENEVGGRYILRLVPNAISRDGTVEASEASMLNCWFSDGTAVRSCGFGEYLDEFMRDFVRRDHARTFAFFTSAEITATTVATDTLYEATFYVGPDKNVSPILRVFVRHELGADRWHLIGSAPDER
jgi:hypothetical protein